MSDPALSQVVYRSVASEPMSPATLRALLTPARERNAVEAITGLLVYDRGCFVHWLEGPRDRVARVWESIRRDPRHHRIERLHTPWRGDRLFPDWRLQLGLAASPVRDHETLEVSHEGLHELHGPAQHAEEFIEGIAFWRALPEPAHIADVLARGSAAEVQALADRMLALHPSVPAVGWHLLGPTARALGDGWSADRFDSSDLLIAQGRLQALIRGVLPSREHAPAARAHHALVVPMPGETHLAGVTYAGIALDAAGWEVTCAFPRDLDALCAAVRTRSVDVLHLAASDAFTRDERMPRLAALIRAAREASANPAMQVLVSGRAFAESPGLALALGADGNGLGHGCDASDLHAMCAFARRRSGSPASMVAQAALNDVAAQAFGRRYPREG